MFKDSTQPNRWSGAAVPDGVSGPSRVPDRSTHDAYDRLRDDRLDFPPHDDREDEERARYEAAGVHEDAAPGTEPC